MEPQRVAARRGPKPKPHTRDNLIRVGARMVHKAGYAATGIKDIVDAAQVPKGSFYNHFESKEAFGAAVADFYFERGLGELQALLSDSRLPPLERLKTYFDDRTRGLRTGGYVRGCLLGNLSLEVADQSPAIRTRIAAHFAAWCSLFETCIAEAQAAGAIRNPAPAGLLAQFLLNSWEGALLRMRSEKTDAPLNEFSEVIFGSLLV